MVRQIDWPNVAGYPPSPFVPGVDRPLKITLLETPECSLEQRKAFDVIRALSRRPHLHVLEGTPGRDPSEDGSIRLRVRVEDDRLALLPLISVRHKGKA